MSSDVEVIPMIDPIEFHLRKNDHVITFTWDGNGVEVGSWFVARGAGDNVFAPYPINQARNMWGSKIEEGYQRIK